MNLELLVFIGLGLGIVILSQIVYRQIEAAKNRAIAKKVATVGNFTNQR